MDHSFTDNYIFEKEIRSLKGRIESYETSIEMLKVLPQKLEHKA